MTDIQEQLLLLLKEIDQICQDNGIEYFIDGGTVLGAIRHRGFLPWDDDIDLGFTRENWLKFEKYVLENPRENRVLEDLHRNDDYTMVYARYCDTSKTCILRTSMIDQFKSGLFIDMFVLDPIPDTKESCKEYFEIVGGYAEYLNPYYYDTIVGANEWYDKFVAMGADQGKQAVIDYVEKKLFSNPDVDGMTYGFRYDGGHFIYPRDVIGKPRRVVFEDCLMPVPEKVEDYLRIHYGDNWYIIPDDSDVEGHNVVIDLEVPYEQFKNSYMGSINRTSAIENYKSLQKLRIDYHRKTKIVDCSNYTVTAQLFGRLISEKQKKAEIKLRELIEQREYDQASDSLLNYFDIQLNKWYIRNQIFVPLEDDALYCALYLLLVEGKYPSADKILKLRLEYNSEESDYTREISMLIEQLRALVKCFERADYAQALAQSEEYTAMHPDIPQFREGYVRAKAALIMQKINEADAQELVEYIEAQEEKFRHRDRVKAVYNMLLFMCGNEDVCAESATELEMLSAKSNDGLLRLEIEDFLKEKV